MDKNRLGVGIVFSGLDRGLAKSADEIARNMTRAADSMKAADQASKGESGQGLLAEIGRGMQQVAAQGKDAFTGFDAGAKMSSEETGGLIQAIQLLRSEVGELGKALNHAQGELGETTKAVQDVKKAASGKGFFADIQRGMSMLSLGRIGSLLHEVKDGMGGAGKGVSEMAKSLDDMGAKMHASLDPAVARRFSSSLSGLLGVGVTAEQASTIGKSLADAGAPLDEMRQALPMIGTMVGKLGMDAKHVADMFGSAVGNLGMSVSEVGDLTKGVVKLQREYQVTDMVEHLPEFIDNAYTNLIRFGKVNKQESMRAVGDLAKMTAGFQKVGFAQSQAVKMSTGFASHISDIRYEFEKMQAGLGGGEKMQELMKAFGAGGLDASELVNAIQTGEKSTDEVLAEMRKMVATVDDPTLKRNMMVRLRESFGPEMAAIFDPLSKDLDKVNEKADEVGKGVTAEKAFNDLSKAMGGTLGFQEKMLETTKQLFEASKDFAARADLVKGMNAQIKAIHEFQDEVGDTDSLLGRVITKLHAWGIVGASMFGENAAKAQFFTEILSGFIFPLTQIVGLGTMLLKPFKAVGSLFAWFGKKLGLVAAEGEAAVGLGTRIGKAFEWVGSTVGKVGKAIMSPMETLGAAAGRVGGVFEALGGVVKKYLIAPFTFIFEKLGGKFLLNMLGKLLPAAVGRFGGVLASWLGGPIVGGIVTVLGLLDLLADIWPWLTTQVRKFAPGVADVMDEIATVVGGAWAEIKAGAMELWNGVKALAGEAWEGIKEGWTALQPYLVMGLKAYWAYVKFVWGAFSAAVKLAWSAIKVGWDFLQPYLTMGLKAYWAYLKFVFGAIVDTVAFTWNALKAGWDVVGPYVIAGFKAWWKVAKFVWGSIFDAVKLLWNAIETGWTWIQPWLIKGFKLLAVVASVAIALIIESVKALWEFYSWVNSNVVKVARATWDAVAGFVEDAMKWIKVKLDAASKWWDDATKEIGAKFGKVWDEIKDGFAAAVKWLGDKASGLKATFADLNPFKGMFDKDAIGGGMAKMIEDNVLAPFNEVAAKIMLKAREIGDAIGKEIPDWVKDIMGGAAAFAAKVKAKAAAIHNALPSFGLGGDEKPSADAAASAAAPSGATKADEAASNVVQMPTPAGTAARDMERADDEDRPRSRPTKNQAGAAAAARSAGVDLSPAHRPVVNDKNFQGIIDAISEERDALAKLLAALLDKDTTVEIKGDMAKFMRAVGSRTAGDTARSGSGDAFAP